MHNGGRLYRALFAVQSFHNVLRKKKKEKKRKKNEKKNEQTRNEINTKIIFHTQTIAMSVNKTKDYEQNH